jgi:hypothetical protein
MAQDACLNTSFRSIRFADTDLSSFSRLRYSAKVWKHFRLCMDSHHYLPLSFQRGFPATGVHDCIRLIGGLEENLCSEASFSDG